jgi:hypothetical protein
MEPFFNLKMHPFALFLLSETEQITPNLTDKIINTICEFIDFLPENYCICVFTQVEDKDQVNILSEELFACFKDYEIPVDLINIPLDSFTDSEIEKYAEEKGIEKYRLYQYNEALKDFELSN